MEKSININLHVASKVFLLGQMADVLTTATFLNMGMQEANIIYQRYGWAPLIAGKIIVSMFAIFVMERLFLDHPYFKVWKWILCIASWLAPVWNLYWMVLEALQ